MDAPEAEPARTKRALLLDHTFGPFFAGHLLSTTGMWIHSVVAAVVVFELTGSATMVGIVTAGQFLPQLLIAPWSGARADRADRRRQMVTGRLISALGSGSLAAIAMSVGLRGTSGAVAVILGSTIAGIGFVTGGPAMQALLPSLVRPNELVGAVALHSLPYNLARAVGPAIGVGLLNAAGPAAAFAVAAVVHVGFAIVIATLSLVPVERAAGGDRSVRAGVRYVRSDRRLVALLLAIAAIGIGADPVVTLTPPVAESLGRGSQLVGWLASAFGIGAGAGYALLSVAQRRLGTDRVGPVGIAIFALGMLGVALAPTPALAVAAIGIAGIGQTLSLTTLTASLQGHVDEDFRGRVMAIWSVAYLGSRPIAASLTGAIADIASVEVALLLVTLVLVVGVHLANRARAVVT